MLKGGMSSSGLLLSIIVLVMSTGVAGAQDQPVAKESPATGAEDTTDDEDGVAPYSGYTTARPGIEERIIVIGESESAADFDAGDSVAGFDASDIEALGALNVADIARFTPNLQIVTAGATSPTFFIRGVGLNDFSSNSTGAVGLFADKVELNAPALQLGTFFDLETVNIERGPIGVGPARGATAGAIRAYTKKPSGEYGGYLRSSFGNYNAVDVEGAIEAPVWKDIFSARVAFRVTERDGYAFNRCGNAIPYAERGVRELSDPFWGDATSPRWSLCGETVYLKGTNVSGLGLQDGKSDIPVGLPTWVNNRFSWAARGNFLFQPTLDQTWLLNVHGSRRDEMSSLGQAYGTIGAQTYPDGTKITKILGGNDNGGYRDQDVKDMFVDTFNALLVPKLQFCQPNCVPNPGDPNNNPVGDAITDVTNTSQILVANQLGANLDTNPHAGAYDRVGPTINDTWGGYIEGEIALPWGIDFTTISAYDAYDRLIDVDLDFSPNVLFEIITDDTGWQFSQDTRLEGTLFNRFIDTEWSAGVYYFKERLRVGIENNFGTVQTFGVAERAYQQDISTVAAWGNLAWDFWDDFTLDGGFRYTWETKAVDYALYRNGVPTTDYQERDQSAPTGMVRLTYRFRDDTHAYWKYTRGWKGLHYNATGNLKDGVTAAEPETIDSFEGGIRGAWLDGRLGISSSFFYYLYDNYQLFTVNNSQAFPEFVIINASDVEVYGADLDMIARPWNGMFIQARVGWLESQFLNFVETQIVEKTIGLSKLILEQKIDHSGNQLLNSPEFEVALTGEQTLSIGRFGNLIFRYDGVWRDDNYFNATEGRGLPNRFGEIFLPPYTLGQKAFWLHNFRGTYRTQDGAFEVSLWVRNLTDVAYRTFSFDAAVFNNTTLHFVGEPRMFGGTVSINF